MRRPASVEIPANSAAAAVMLVEASLNATAALIAGISPSARSFGRQSTAPSSSIATWAGNADIVRPGATSWYAHLCVRLVAKARELRDRWIEHVSVHEIEHVGGRYEVSRLAGESNAKLLRAA